MAAASIDEKEAGVRKARVGEAGEAHADDTTKHEEEPEETSDPDERTERNQEPESKAAGTDTMKREESTANIITEDMDTLVNRKLGFVLLKRALGKIWNLNQKEALIEWDRQYQAYTRGIHWGAGMTIMKRVVAKMAKQLNWEAALQGWQFNIKEERRTTKSFLAQFACEIVEKEDVSSKFLQGPIRGK